MNSRTSLAVLAILTVVAALSIPAAYAETCGDPHIDRECYVQKSRVAAEAQFREALPITVWTEQTDYGHEDIIMVEGMVSNTDAGFPVTLRVVSPLNSIVDIRQVTADEDGSWSTTLNTSGENWKYDGTYTIKANYGSADYDTKVELTGGVEFVPNYLTPSKCSGNEIGIDTHCIPYTIEGGMVTGASINTADNSIIINIDAEQDGVLTISPATKIIDGIFLVLVDGQEWDDVEIVENSATIMFPAGAEDIEVIGTFVIPEFGAIAAMILAVAIISVIAISARSRLSIMPRY